MHIFVADSLHFDHFSWVKYTGEVCISDVADTGEVCISDVADTGEVCISDVADTGEWFLARYQGYRLSSEWSSQALDLFINL